jgi:hypothetical protein
MAVRASALRASNIWEHYQIKMRFMILKAVTIKGILLGHDAV